ncbi:GNAT family N-acetyltransferase [Kitasatospora sp. NPDC096147]|uniref:GNAT family N-acetyltransferase n=1 Tax=Kitasatospora sp. NPDC096147 TaxID=3364093 RepID=UPI0038038C6A
MINDEALRNKPTLTGDRIRLVPLAPAHAEAAWRTLQDPELLRLTGTTRQFTRAEIDDWCATRADQPDRLDLAVEDLRTGTFLGDLALNELDRTTESASFRIALDPTVAGRGLGTQATRLLLAHAFDAVGLHRVHLEVFSYNPRAQAAYLKAGFVLEGRLRDAHLWDGTRHDILLMAALAPEWRAAPSARPAPQP